MQEKGSNCFTNLIRTLIVSMKSRKQIVMTQIRVLHSGDRNALY